MIFDKITYKFLSKREIFKFLLLYCEEQVRFHVNAWWLSYYLLFCEGSTKTCLRQNILLFLFETKFSSSFTERALDMSPNFWHDHDAFHLREFSRCVQERRRCNGSTRLATVLRCQLVCEYSQVLHANGTSTHVVIVQFFIFDMQYPCLMLDIDDKTLLCNLCDKRQIFVNSARPSRNIIVSHTWRLKFAFLF